MQKMSEEQAIVILKGAIKKPNTEDGYMGQAITLAIKALEKQNMVNEILHECTELKKELDAYKAIGTLDQCREAVERVKPKKPIEYEDKYYGCPKCGNALMHKWEKYPTILIPKRKGLPCCLNCLQAIDWSE